MYHTAKLISTHHNIDIWRVIGNHDQFETEFMHGATEKQVLEFYN